MPKQFIHSSIWTFHWPPIPQYISFILYLGWVCKQHFQQLYASCPVVGKWDMSRTRLFATQLENDPSIHFSEKSSSHNVLKFDLQDCCQCRQATSHHLSEKRICDTYKSDQYILAISLHWQRDMLPGYIDSTDKQCCIWILHYCRWHTQI